MARFECKEMDVWAILTVRPVLKYMVQYWFFAKWGAGNKISRSALVNNTIVILASIPPIKMITIYSEYFRGRLQIAAATLKWLDYDR